MRKRIAFLLLGIFAACETIPPATVVVEKTIADYAAATYPAKGWADDYNAMIDLLLKSYPLKTPCEPKLFLKAMAYAESSHNNSSYYMEPAPLNKYSIGLFQLSLTDAKYYPCLFKTEKEIENPALNIDCAIKIMHKLQTKYPSESVYEQLGRYWSILRWDAYSKWVGKSQNGFIRFRKYLSENGCKL